MVELQTFDVEAARRGFVRRSAVYRERLSVMAQGAQADFCRIKDMLIEVYHPRRIYQWGSLLHPERFQEISDIDIAVEGWEDPMTGLHALDAACQLTRFPVDLVELERIHPAHADTIRNEGRLVYDRDA
jgi:predicted nucleotidyltransferase